MNIQEITSPAGTGKSYYLLPYIMATEPYSGNTSKLIVIAQGNVEDLKNRYKTHLDNQFGVDVSKEKEKDIIFFCLDNYFINRENLKNDLLNFLEEQLDIEARLFIDEFDLCLHAIPNLYTLLHKVPFKMITILGQRNPLSIPTETPRFPKIDEK
jgi:hypothetical protein